MEQLLINELIMVFISDYNCMQGDIGQEAVFKHAFDQINSDERKFYLRTPSIKDERLGNPT